MATDTREPEPTLDADHEELPPEPGDIPQPPPAPAAELVHRPGPAGSTAMLQAESPAAMLDKAKEIANVLDSLIKDRGLATRIGNKDHVQIEAWQTLSTLLGCAPIIRWTRPVTDPATGRPKLTEYEVHVKDYEWVAPEGGGRKQKRHKADRSYTVRGYSWEACCEVVKDGVVLATAEAMVTREEDRWAGADDYAIRSMAQTRAQSRAIAAAARWVVTLAGYSGTPAEEMAGHAADQANANAEPARPPTWAEASSPELDKLAKQALIYLAGSAEKASELYAAIVAEPGHLPKATGQAIVRIGSEVQRRQQAARQDRAAEAPQAPQEAPGDGEPSYAGRPSPGTLDPTDET